LMIGLHFLGSLGKRRIMNHFCTKWPEKGWDKAGTGYFL
jgi:hypothetical protein